MAPELDQGWIRAVLFERGIDGWVDLALQPHARPWAGDVYAEQVTACYQQWKWLSDADGSDVDEAPEAAQPAEPLAALAGASSWTELMAGLAVVARAQAMLTAVVMRRGGDTARRALDKARRDCAGHAALGYLELRQGAGIDADVARAALDRLVPATRAWLEAVSPESVEAWSTTITSLLKPLGYLS